MSGYLTVAAVAERLDVSTRTVLRWVEAGDLAAVRLPGGRLRVAEAELATRIEGWATAPRRILAAIGDEEGNP